MSAHQVAPAAARDEYGFELSFAQARLWVIDQLAPGAPLYNLRCAVYLRQALDIPALQRAVNAVVERHESLRTVFREVDGRPVQVVLPPMNVPLVGADLRRVAPERREPAVVRLATELADRPFRLDEGPLLRLTLVWLGPSDYVLVIVVHHIVADGWSVGVLSRELGALYEGFAAGRPVRLAPLPVQYADFAVWQRRWLSGERLAEQMAYWREALEDLPTLGLPADRPRPAVQAHRGAGLAFQVPEAVAQALGRVARREGATLFMALLAGVAAMLGRWAGQHDVVVGAPIAGRTRPELEGLIGFFVNTLVMRVDLLGTPSFAELVRRVRERALGAYAHADLPFEKLVEELAPQRDLSRNPLFQVTFQLFESPGAPDAVGARQAGLEIPVTSSLFDLRIDMWPAPGGLAGRVEYDTDLFERASIEWMLERLVWLLEQAAADPERPVWALSALPPVQERLLERFNDTAAPAPRACAHEAVAEQASRRPAAEAVSDAAGSWSYGELEARANRLCHLLVGMGVGPGARVALCLERGRAFVAGALAAMKAGAAYLPLDPAYPAERLGHLLADAAPAALLVDDAGAEGPPVPAGCRVIGLADWPEGPADAPPALAGPADPAYLIYTSGSTGTPKGVVIEHHSLMNLVAWHGRAYAIGPADRGAQIASVGFDAAVWEIWPYLCAGASVHVCPDEVRADAGPLADWLADERISVAFVPTPLAELLLERPWPERARLRLMLTGGDRLRSWANPAHPYELVNHYGPTEATVVTSAGPVPAEPRGGRLPSIGAPIANTVCHVVDPADGALLGPGCPGELWVGGAGLARGYHADPALSAERFVANPFGPEPERLYRTGDRVRWQRDGALAFLGRTDDQVKIRGHRVEPREVEALLGRHPAVRQAVVVARPQPDGAAPRLVAYLTIAPERDDERRRQVDHWRVLYQQTYGEGESGDPEFDIRGWNSSDDGAALGEDVMREQVDQTVARIATLEPRRILEIGCGTGLLVFRLAGACERYRATDFSEAALGLVRAGVARRGWDHVELVGCAADETEPLDAGGVDVVVLNSVVQYFPDADYLARVLDRALACLRPGGSVFVGDVRNHALHEAFHASVALAGAPDDLPARELRRRVRRRVETEQELLLDPAWFTRFAAARGRPRVSAWPRRGRHHTELTRFRYDVTLTPGAAEPGGEAVAWLDWEADGLDVTGLAQRIAASPGPLGVRAIPSARLEGALAVLGELETAPGDRTAGELRSVLTARRGGVDPEDLWELGGDRELELGWHGSGAGGRYDLLAAPAGQPGLGPPPVPDGPLCNDPLRHADRRAAEVREWLRERLPEAMLPSAVVVLDDIPLTAHGKADLSALPAPEEPAARQDAAPAPPAGDIERRLAGLWAETLGLPSVGIDDNFFELGGDSILSIKLASRAADEGIHFSTKQLFQHQTVAELARVASSRPRVEAEQGPVVGPVPLTPIQRWLLEQDLAEAHHFNQAALLPVARTVSPNLLARALHAVVAHHDALHLRVVRAGDEWRQRCDPPDRELAVTSVDLSAIGADEIPEALERAGARLQASLRLDGPLVRVALFSLGTSQPRRLLVAIHHLAVDGVSWGILVEDLWRAYTQLAEGGPVSLPPKTTSFRQWAKRLAEAAGAPGLAEQRDVWLEQLPEDMDRLPRDLPGTDNRVAVTRQVRVELDRDETEALLRRLLAERRVEINDVLLYALAASLHDWTDRPRAAIAVEGHGREPLFEDVDLSRTVGWFTSIFPVLLAVPAEAGAPAGLRAVADHLRRIPDRGIGFGLLRYLSPDAAMRELLAARPWPEVSFNYLGQLDDGPADPLRELTGPQRSPAGSRVHLLEVNGAVTGGVLRFDFIYSSEIHREETIGAVAGAFMGEIRALLAALPATPAPGDGAPGVSARDMETLLARLAGDGGEAP
jgi:amino acid adenylation domain-containing protein/non-ribosomal peptide synthase protein (TIGR01720 family)